MTPIVVFGAGGLAREVAWLIRRLNRVEPRWTFEGFVVTDPDAQGPNDARDQVVGDTDWLLARDDVAVVLGMGNPRARVAVGRQLSEHMADHRFPALIDPSVIMDEDSIEVQPGAVITAGNILTVGIRVERFAYINLDCTVGHEAVVGAGSVLNPSVNISGGVRIGEGVLVGTGAQILQYHRIGDGATVGAGALVTRDVEPGQTVMGIPARPRG